MVDEAAAVLEVVADNLWVEWGARVLLNVVARVKAEGGEGSESVSKALELLFAADAEKDVDKDIARREVCRQEKLEAFLDERKSSREILKETRRRLREARQWGTRSSWRLRLRYQERWMWTVGRTRWFPSRHESERHHRHPRPYGKRLALVQEVRRWRWRQLSVRLIRWLVSGVHSRG